MVALITALLGGLIVFGLQTSRLRLLGEVMRSYARKSREGNMSIRYPVREKSKDESIVNSSFNLKSLINEFL